MLWLLGLEWKVFVMLCVNEQFFFILFQCSYRPGHCSQNTKKIFESRGAFDGQEFTCYYSPTEPIKVILEKNKPPQGGFYVILALVFCFGVGLIITIKFLGQIWLSVKVDGVETATEAATSTTTRQQTLDKSESKTFTKQWQIRWSSHYCFIERKE